MPLCRRRRHDVRMGVPATRPPPQRRTGGGGPARDRVAGQAVDLRRVHGRPGRPPPTCSGSWPAVAPSRSSGRSGIRRSRTGPTSWPTCSSTSPAGRAERAVAKRAPGLLPYCIVAGSMSLGYGSIYTLLADLRDRYGFTEAQLGVIVAAGFLAGFVAQLALARLADRGYAPLLVRGGVLLAMAAIIGSAAATEFWAFLLARLLLGLGSGAVGPAIRRIAITRDPDAVGLPTSGASLRSTSPASCSDRWSPRSSPRDSASTHPSWSSPRCSSGCLCARAPPRPHHRRRDAGDADNHALRTLLVRPAIQATLATGIAFYLTVGMFEAIWAVLLRDHGAETWLIGLTLSMFTLPMIFLAPIGGRMAQRHEPVRVGHRQPVDRDRLHVLLRRAAEPLDAAGGFVGAHGRRLVHHAEQPGRGGARQPSRAPVGRAGAARCDRPRGRRTHRPRHRLPLRGGGSRHACAPAPRRR